MAEPISEQAPRERRSPRRRQREEPGDGLFPPQRRDAIHRALLAGLLGSVGQKTDIHEYTGPRGIKFNIFPGSALFKKNPPWLMAAELVETTRLYARTAAPIDPRWVERAAQHLVKRAYSEPHWKRENATVVAHEKVSLWGLPLIAGRVVNYGPVDPIKARELFIWNALVEGEYNTDAQYFRGNRELIRDLELMEAKMRSRSVLVDARTRYAFYDARIPAGIHSGYLFERWRREVERDDKRLLFMTREDLMLRGAKVAEPGLYPDFMQAGGVHVRLDYRLDPGHPADGVTATIPLAALNGLPAEPFEWLAPGMLRDKILALIRTLPKPLRVPFVPAPASADAAARGLIFGQGRLTEALARQLGKQSGMTIPPDAFAPAELPDHLHMHFRIVDESGRTVAAGRDLQALRVKLGAEARSAFESLAETAYQRNDITRWDFGDLPEKVEVRHRGRTLLGYPALVDQTTRVAVRLLDAPLAARVSHQAGVRRLFALQLGQEMKYLGRNLPGLESMCLHYAPLGSCDQLRQQLLDAIADRALFAGAAEIRTQEEFVARAEAGWRRLSEASRELSSLAGEILGLYHELSLQLGREFPPLLRESIQDMRHQVSRLVPADFLTRTPSQWLAHVPRFLRGVQIRLNRLLNAGLARDQQAMSQVRPHVQRVDGQLRTYRRETPIPLPLEQHRWLVEELRISLFAQELKTSQAVSSRRLDENWAAIRPGLSAPTP